jgi:hypothetical protein
MNDTSDLGSFLSAVRRGCEIWVNFIGTGPGAAILEKQEAAELD